MTTHQLLHCQKHSRSWTGDGTDSVQTCPWCEIERLRAELASAREAARTNWDSGVQESVRVAELMAEVERLRAEVAVESKIRRYIAFVLAGDPAADSQLAADDTMRSLHECRRLLREAFTYPFRVTEHDWIQAARAAGGEG